MYLKFKKYLYEFIRKYTYENNICLIDQPYDIDFVDLVESQETDKLKRIYSNSQFRSNTSPNLNIDRNVFIKSKKNSENSLQEEQKLIQLEEIDWFCKTCCRKISRYSNIYCCNDNIFCTPNCRDRFLNYLSNK